ncbi:phosphotransferase enzyme family protein [Aspergillus granulosus]|uniref:Phosphotransferase enzyme family protein n=1 Tax=Aspergillus granulosus TaxID=176169 RepID=A0ABR4HL38_9EURO
MANNGGPVRLTLPTIPDYSNFDNKNSSFFRRWRELPSPKEVKVQAEYQHLAGVNPDPRRVYSMDMPHITPPPVVFEDMGLFIKWGSSVQISEALGLLVLGQVLDGHVPVPEVYGWRTDGDATFIYIRGQTLEQAWDIMEPGERVTICRELRTICDNLRRLQQDPSDTFVGSMTRGPLYDRAFHENFMHEAGPFMTVRDFHNWFTFLCRRPMADPHSVPVEPFRDELPDSCEIKFTHGDLHRSNIIVTPHRPYRTLAIVDWEQSGWFPAYWEARKAQYTADWREEWSTRYLPMILEQYTATRDAWEYYTASIGC